MDFTNFYGFVKKMVQKNQYTYNLMGRTGWTGWTGGTVPKSVI